MNYIKIIVALLLIVLNSSCEKLEIENNTIEIDTPDWTEATHGSTAAPDYSTVFEQNVVKRIDITISSDNWNAILDELAANLQAGPGPGQGPGPGPGQGPGQPMTESFEPSWVACDVFFNNIQWYKVGIRVKGNSSLRSTYQAGIRKFSFKLDFDEYESTYPAIQDQRFYGFKQLNLNNNFDDKSLIREKVASDLFREFGIPSAQSAFYEVYVNINGESQYFGLYTMVEEVDNTVIKTQFDSNEGNLYKPEGTGASFAYGSFNTNDMYKKTNDDISDWSDIKSLYDALHSTLRTTDPAAWRVQFEQNINMELYLKWLAANTVMQNWDTYGVMTHNYYLYNDPTSSKFVWIPWDNNEALQDGKMGGAIDIDLSDVSNQWPLINFIASDPVYYALYKQYAKDFVTSVFEPSKMNATYNSYNSLIQESMAKEVSPYTFLKNGINDFNTAFSQLQQHVTQRNILVNSL